MRFTVTDVKNKPENGVSRLKYEYEEEYYTQDSETNETSWESEYKIYEGYSKIPLELLDDWINAVMEYINNYNGKLKQDVAFKVDMCRTNAMYHTLKFINNVQVEESWKDFGMIPEDEIDAWAEAVTEYYNKENIPMPRDEVKNSINEVNSSQNSGTTPFDSDTIGSTPSIPSAIATATSDPCKFPSAIMQAVKTGLTSPLDTLRNTVIKAKQKINAELSIITDDFNTAVGQIMDPVINAIEQQLNNRTSKDDLQSEYISKKHSTIITNIEALLEDDGSQDIPNDSNAQTEEEPLLISNNDKYEIPAWAAKKIAAAMKGKFGHNGVPAQDTLTRFNNHKDYFTRVFKNYGVPEQLIVLSIIESNVKNISRETSATAKGMWQFTRLNAQQYGLLKLQLKPGLRENYNKYNDKNYDIVSNYDKRDQLEPSTEAAAKALRDIRKDRPKIYNWLFAAAGYNWGGENVSRVITKAGNGADFWEVWKIMPLETRNYICLIIGLNQYFGMPMDPLFE